jgi:hypothetical protein
VDPTGQLYENMHENSSLGGRAKADSVDFQQFLTITTDAPPHEVVFVDPAVPDHASLLSSLVDVGPIGAGSNASLIPSGPSVVVLEPNHDGIKQITRALRNYQNL